MIGAAKSGTTSLAHLLDQHPHLTVAEPKEPDFYTRHWGLGLDWYRQTFAGAEGDLLLDASTSYSSAPLGEAEPALPITSTSARRKFTSPGK